MTSIEILVRGRLADSFLSLLSDRFGDLTVLPDRTGDRTSIAGVMDQASARALLALLWDTGHSVISMHSTPTEHH